MTPSYDDKRDAVKRWTSDACGLSGAQGLEVGTKAFFERVDGNRYEEYVPWMKSTLEFGEFRGKKLLEVGFGMGTDLFQFASSGAIVSGVGLSREHLRIAALRFATYGKQADLRLADGEHPPFADASFDAVYSFGSFTIPPKPRKPWKRCTEFSGRGVGPSSVSITGSRRFSSSPSSLNRTSFGCASCRSRIAEQFPGSNMASTATPARSSSYTPEGRCEVSCVGFRMSGLSVPTWSGRISAPSGCWYPRESCVRWIADSRWVGIS